MPRSEAASDRNPIPEPEGEAAGIPYDFRKPDAERLKARAWNRDDPRFFTPKLFGWGYTINWYWLLHPVAYFGGRRRR